MSSQAFEQVYGRLKGLLEGLLTELETLTRRGYDATGGDPRWGAARRAER